MLQSDKPAQCLADLMSLGLLGVFVPEFEEGVGVEQGSYHTKDVWGHTLDVVREAAEREGSLIVRLGALFHDIGKPRSRSTEEGGRVRFFGHERAGAQMTLDILRRLRFGRRFSEEVAKIVANHMRLGSALPFTASAARRIVRDMGDLLEPLLQVCQADAVALGGKPNGVDFAAIRERIEEVNEKAQRSNLESPLSGSEIMAALGLAAGPEVGKLKDRLTEAVLSGSIAPGDKEAALALIQLSEGET
jgi:poly(A) polymerase